MRLAKQPGQLDTEAHTVQVSLDTSNKADDSIQSLRRSI